MVQDSVVLYMHLSGRLKQKGTHERANWEWLRSIEN